MPADVTQLSDEHLVSRVRTGDDDAFAFIAHRYRSWLVRLCARSLGDRHLAEDVAQETLVKAYRLIADDRAPDRLRPWLRVVARHACIDEHRRRVPEPVEALPEEYVTAVRDDCTSPADVVTDDLDAPLATAWDRLDPRHREVLRQREIRGLSYAEVAAAMGLSLAAVETLLFRARAALRREYVRAGGGPLPPDAIVRGLVLVDAGQTRQAAPIVRALGIHAGQFAADAGPAAAHASQSSGTLDGWRELAAGVAATVLALALVAPPGGGGNADDVAVPKVDAMVVPSLTDPPVLPDAPAAPPEASVDDTDADAPDAPQAPAPEPPPQPEAEADEEQGRIRDAVATTRSTAVATVERVTGASTDLAQKILD